MGARSVERREDMSANGTLKIFQQADGDLIVICEKYDENTKRFERGTAEFCALGAGGGRSPNVRDALLALMAAIELDNKERPIADGV